MAGGPIPGLRSTARSLTLPFSLASRSSSMSSRANPVRSQSSCAPRTTVTSTQCISTGRAGSAILCWKPRSGTWVFLRIARSRLTSTEVPAGCSTGTSAAVVVALVGALDRLQCGGLGLREVAYAAHAVEVEMLKQQSGIQDQLCSSYGGINYIEIDRYPHALVSALQVPSATWWELERRLALVHLGRSHSLRHPTPSSGTSPSA